MEEIDCKKIISLLKSEVLPALGCTEPVAVALAAAKARSFIDAFPEKITVILSGNVLKNGMGVGIPGTGMVGLPIAAALGAIGGNPDRSLEVLTGVSDEDIKKAKGFVAEGNVSIKCSEGNEKLYIEAHVAAGQEMAEVTICGNHTNIVRIVHNGEVVLENIDTRSDQKGCSEELPGLSIESICRYAETIDLEEIQFLVDGARQNQAVGEEGLKGEYGLRVGKTIKNQVFKGLVADDLTSYAMSLTAAASDARMAGSTLPVMSNSGSGNQGITVMVPIVAAADKLKCDDETLARALFVGNMVAIHIKKYLGRLSALCGVIVAAAGASSGITWILGGRERQICYAIKNIVGNLSGMICDGAKAGCALKVSTSVSAAIQSAFLAMDEISISESDGIIEKDVEKTIRNLATIGSEAMNETDRMILDIMVNK